jgi:YHS domain-containing protein
MRFLIVLGLAAGLAACIPSPEVAWQSRGDRVLGLGSDLAEDPVTGTLVEKKPAVKRHYRGTTYYFESGESAAMFDANPSVYAVGETLPPGDRSDREVR